MRRKARPQASDTRNLVNTMKAIWEQQATSRRFVWPCIWDTRADGRINYETLFPSSASSESVVIR
jgi:hypothetical protein